MKTFHVYFKKYLVENSEWKKSATGQWVKIVGLLTFEISKRISPGAPTGYRYWLRWGYINHNKQYVSSGRWNNLSNNYANSVQFDSLPEAKKYVNNLNFAEIEEYVKNHNPTIKRDELT
jgi:hypothetical protein